MHSAYIAKNSEEGQSMAEIYIGFVDTPGILASLIRRNLGQRYIHVVIGLDQELREAYSFGRRHPALPVIAGFEREEREKINRVFPSAWYQICKVDCTEEQKAFIAMRMRQMYENRFRYHYAVEGLLAVLLGKPLHIKNHETCSSFAAGLLKEAGILDFKKAASLVTPKDFYLYEKKEIVYEGSLQQLLEGEHDSADWMTDEDYGMAVL